MTDTRTILDNVSHTRQAVDAATSILQKLSDLIDVQHPLADEIDDALLLLRSQRVTETLIDARVWAQEAAPVCRLGRDLQNLMTALHMQDDQFVRADVREYLRRARTAPMHQVYGAVRQLELWPEDDAQ